MLDAAIGSGADIFITIVVLGLSFVAGIVAIDVLKAIKENEPEND